MFEGARPRQNLFLGFVSSAALYQNSLFFSNIDIFNIWSASAGVWPQINLFYTNARNLFDFSFFNSGVWMAHALKGWRCSLDLDLDGGHFVLVRFSCRVGRHSSLVHSARRKLGSLSRCEPSLHLNRRLLPFLLTRLGQACELSGLGRLSWLRRAFSRLVGDHLVAAHRRLGGEEQNSRDHDSQHEHHSGHRYVPGGGHGHFGCESKRTKAGSSLTGRVGGGR